MMGGGAVFFAIGLGVGAAKEGAEEAAATGRGDERSIGAAAARGSNVRGSDVRDSDARCCDRELEAGGELTPSVRTLPRT